MFLDPGRVIVNIFLGQYVDLQVDSRKGASISLVETPAMDEFLVSIFRLKYVIGDIEGSNDELHLYVFHMPAGIKKKYYKLEF